MPSHRPRSRRSRLIAPIVLGVVAFVGIGSVAAGTTLAPEPLAPVGAVAGAVDPAVDPAADPAVDPAIAPTSALTSALPAAKGATADLGAIAPPPPVPLDASQAVAPGPPDPPPPPRADPPPLAGLIGYRWPLARGRLTLPFGPSPWGSRIVAGESFHDGIDLATVCGDRIVAAHDGIVLAAGRHYDDTMGWAGDLTAYYQRLEAKKLWSSLPIVVVIDDGNGYRSIYAHFGKIVVQRGQQVLAGDLLGYEGQTGRASGCHLHYGLFSPYERATFAIDPAVVKRMKVPGAQIARIDPLLVLPDRAKLSIGADTVVR